MDLSDRRTSRTGNEGRIQRAGGRGGHALARRLAIMAVFGSVLALLSLLASPVPLKQASAQAEAPTAQGWGGAWLTRWRGGGATLELEAESGGRVSGRYPLYEGTIEARAEGDRLAGIWAEPSGSGACSTSPSRRSTWSSSATCWAARWPRSAAPATS